MTSAINLESVTIHNIVEQQVPIFDAEVFFPSLEKAFLDEHRQWLEPTFIDPATGKVILCVQSYVVKTPHHTILVDSCVGNHKTLPHIPNWNQMDSRRYETNLAAAGVSVDDIDYVMCTHMHADHVGWNTRLDNGRWVPTFPNARYLFADREYAHWEEKAAQDPSAFPWMVESVLPVIAAGRADLVKSDHQVNDLVTLVPTPGHTIDHFSVHVGKAGSDAFLTGDMVHSPLQTRFPEIGMRADYDSPMAGQTRRTIFERYCDTPTLICTAHFPTPSIGRLTRWDDGFRIS